jgi:hypothetical protein
MSAITIDTYALITSLKEAGIPEQQAKAQIDAIAKVAEITKVQIQHDHKLDDVATRRDLKETEDFLKRDIRESELRLESKIKDVELKISESKAELVRWVIGAGFLQVALISSLILRLVDKI